MRQYQVPARVRLVRVEPMTRRAQGRRNEWKSVSQRGVMNDERLSRLRVL